MRVLVIGATASCGHELLRQGVEGGHSMIAFARRPENIALPLKGKVLCVRGDVYSLESLEHAVALHKPDAIINIIGHVQGSPANLLEVSSENLVYACNKYGVRRLLALTGMGVPQPGDEPKFSDRFFGFLLRTLVPTVLSDQRAAMECVQREAGGRLDYCIVRIPRLVDGPPSPAARLHAGPLGKGSGSKVHRADVAQFCLMHLAAGGPWRNSCPVLSSLDHG